MTPDVAELLAAILADLDQLHRDALGVRDALDGFDDTLEAARVSLGALRGVVAGDQAVG